MEVFHGTATTQVPALTLAIQAGTRFTYPGGMEGWVDLVDLIAPRLGVEPATFRSRVQRSTNATTNVFGPFVPLWPTGDRRITAERPFCFAVDIRYSICSVAHVAEVFIPL